MKDSTWSSSSTTRMVSENAECGPVTSADVRPRPVCPVSHGRLSGQPSAHLGRR